MFEFAEITARGHYLYNIEESLFGVKFGVNRLRGGSGKMPALKARRYTGNGNVLAMLAAEIALSLYTEISKLRGSVRA